MQKCVLPVRKHQRILLWFMNFTKGMTKLLKGQNLTVKHIWNTYLSGFPVDP